MICFYSFGLPMCLTKFIWFSDSQFSDYRVDIGIFCQLIEPSEDTYKPRKQNILFVHRKTQWLRSTETLSACSCCNALTFTSPRCSAAMPSAAARAAASVVMVGMRAVTAARRMAFSSK